MHRRLVPLCRLGLGPKITYSIVETEIERASHICLHNNVAIPNPLAKRDVTTTDLARNILYQHWAVHANDESKYCTLSSGRHENVLLVSRCATASSGRYVGGTIWKLQLSYR